LNKIFQFLIVKKKLAKNSLAVLKIWVQKERLRIKKRQLVIKLAKKLRNDGLTYRQIGKRLDIDFGYARRVSLKK
jgi:IS5 family transposase